MTINKRLTAAVAAVSLGLACAGTSVSEIAQPEDTNDEVAEVATGAATVWTTAVDPKPMTETVTKALDWLVSRQLESGGWGQGEESSQMGNSMQGFTDKANVADTCIALLALIRTNEDPAEGRYAANLRGGLKFVCGQIAESDADSLYVTDVRGTRVQSKIGTYIDTFLASMVLAEVKGRLATDEENTHVDECLGKVLHKIEVNQREGGGWDNNGWAPVLAQSVAGKGIYRALQNGFDVPEELLAGSDDFFLGEGERSASGPASPGSAGISLYSSSAGLGGMQEWANSSPAREVELRDQAENAPDEDARNEAKDELGKIEVGRKAHAQVQETLVGRLDDPSFVSGFGSNGGEEFLSYMNISESLVVRADDAWERWDGAMAQNLSRVQNGDGSWSGHHCITGRTFCTSAALLVLMADRTPVPVEMVASAAK